MNEVRPATLTSSCDRALIVPRRSTGRPETSRVPPGHRLWPPRLLPTTTNTLRNQHGSHEEHESPFPQPVRHPPSGRQRPAARFGGLHPLTSAGRPPPAHPADLGAVRAGVLLARPGRFRTPDGRPPARRGGQGT